MITVPFLDLKTLNLSIKPINHAYERLSTAAHSFLGDEVSTLKINGHLFVVLNIQ